MDKLKKEYDKYFVGIAQHMITLPADEVINMDENNFYYLDENNFLDEVMDAGLSSGKNKAPQNIGVAKQSTITIFDRKYVDWEAWQAPKLVEKNTRIVNDLVRNQVEQALNEPSKQTKEMQNQALQNQQTMKQSVEVLMSAMNLLLPNHVTKNGTLKKDTTRDAVAA